MFKKILLSKFLVVILLSFLSVSFSYANDHNCEQLLNEVDNDAALCFKAEETKDVCYLKEVSKRDLTCPSDSDKIPSNANKAGSGWVCNTGYIKSGSGCVKQPSSLKIPINAHKAGSGWVCNMNYYRNKAETLCLKVPANSTSSFSSNYFKCNSGYAINGNRCVKVSSGCDGFAKEINITAFDNKSLCNFSNMTTEHKCYLKEANNRNISCNSNSGFWSCKSGYRISGEKCVKKIISQKIPKNSHKDGSSWTCDTNYYRNNAKTACMNAPANSTSPFSSNEFKCNTGYEKSANSCSKGVGVDLTSTKSKLTMFSMYAFIVVISIFTLILIIKYFGDGITKKLRNVLDSINKKNGSKKDPKPLSESLSVPKEPEIKISTSDIEGNISYQTETIKSLKNDLSTLMKSISEMNQTFMTLKANLDQKDKEISRLKDGYDATIFRGFILRFTRVDKVLKENLRDKKYSLHGLEDIQIQMEDALAECSIEIFSPALGADFKTSEGVADNPKQIDTTDKNKNLTVAEVLQPGYRRRLPDSNDDDFQIITEAKVAIYVYKI